MLKRDENVSMSMNYAEYVVTKKAEGALLVKRIITCLVFFLLFVVLSYIVFQGTPVLEILVIAVCGIGWFFTYSSLKIENEYVVASAKVEFNRITGQRKRKEIITVSLDDVERIAPYNDETAAYIKEKNVSKVYDFCSSKKSKRRYFMMHKKDGIYQVIYFDAVSKTLDVLKFFRSSLVEIDKEIYDM